MSIVFLNGEYLPMEEAKISPMDRGFLFGDGIYEVVPSYNGRLVGFGPHILRMKTGLDAIALKLDFTENDWRKIAERLIQDNGSGNLGIYLHVSRGADDNRFHAYPQNVMPTIFAFVINIPAEPVADKNIIKGYRVASCADLRWKRCNIKSTSLLGNVMHFQQGYDAGVNETILFNQYDELTEATTSNVFVVKNDIVSTPPLGNQLLPGITRLMLLDMLRKDNVIKFEERTISKQEVLEADEIWLTSSSKEIVPVVELDGKPVGNGKVGDIWQFAQTLYSANKYHY
jgi:D-alanine transaminase